eukprot:4449303-Ditylum_brightwellii.AAC.1
MEYFLKFPKSLFGTSLQVALSALSPDDADILCFSANNVELMTPAKAAHLEDGPVQSFVVVLAECQMK